ncbi:MAG: hypothetical protein WA632_09895 [Gallionella sp.]
MSMSARISPCLLPKIRAAQAASLLGAASLAVALFFLPSPARAAVYISATGGAGPDGYRSTQVRANADLFDSPISASVFRFQSSSSSDSISQSGQALNWKVTKLAIVGLDHNNQDNGLVDISGNAVRLALNLDTLWSGTLGTRLDMKRDASAYRFNSLPAAVQNDTINQTANSLGLSQNIAASLTIYAAHDQYSYDKDPTRAAILLMRTAPRRFFSTSSALLAVPDSTNLFGIAWHPQDELTVDVSSSKTQTQLEQEQHTKRLGLDYQLTDHFNFSAAVSRVTSTAVVTRQTYFAAIPALTIPIGTTVIPASNDTYSELGVSWTF